MRQKVTPEQPRAPHESADNVRQPIAPTQGVLAEDTTDAPFDIDLAYDRAYGAILGGAIGEAFGLQVQGGNATTIQDLHPEGMDLPYQHPEGVVLPYEANDWSDGTDLSVLVMRVLTKYFISLTEEPEIEFAKAIRRWQQDGFRELGDTMGVGTESVVARVLQQQNFTANPCGAARAVKGPKAENGALLRTAPCAFTSAPAEWAILFCETTHADERCVASTVMLSLMLNRLSRVPSGTTITPDIIIDAIAEGRRHIPIPLRQKDYMTRLTHSKALEDLSLDSPESRSYTLKTLACAMWAFRQLARAPPADRHAGLFRAAIIDIASQGGDSSANCAVVGMVLGAALGLKQLPEEWLAALPSKEWLMMQVAAFLQAAEPTWQKERL
jgi:ADP-ribosylglycohydrolase